jgi:DNA-binding Lrp family transcriptional regulator
VDRIAIHHRRSTANRIVLRRLNGYHVIAAYILIQTEPGKAALVAAALRDLPDVSEAASVAGPYDVIALAQGRNIDELAKLVTSQVQARDGVRRTMSCPVVHL